jgi:hypothetical protein
LSVERGASEDLPYSEHVRHLREQGLVESFGGDWAELIRSRHDGAPHEVRYLIKTAAGEPIWLLEEALAAMEREA